MNIVWPVTALFGGPIWLWGYFSYGTVAGREHPGSDKSTGGTETRPRKPFAIVVAEGTSHCGSGCALGDLLAEWLVWAVPATAVWFGWQSLFSEQMFAVWVLDFIAAYFFGIVFQYFAIAPMRGLSVPQGLWAAVKADTLSLSAWQVGMYGFMGIARLWLFGRVLGMPLPVDCAEYWFLMQIAMLCGFATAYPVNWWLLRAGIKEPM